MGSMRGAYFVGSGGVPAEFRSSRSVATFSFREAAADPVPRVLHGGPVRRVVARRRFPCRRSQVGWKIADRQKSLAKSASLGAMSPWATSQGRSGTRGGTRKGPRPGGPPRPERIEERFDMDPEGPWRILAVHADGTNEMRGRPASSTSPAI